MQKIISKKTLSCLTVLVGITLMGMTAGNAEVTHPTPTPISIPCEDITDKQTCQGQPTPKCHWVNPTLPQCTGGPNCGSVIEKSLCKEGCQWQEGELAKCIEKPKQ